MWMVRQIRLSIDRDGEGTDYQEAPLGSILFNDSGIVEGSQYNG